MDNRISFFAAFPALALLLATSAFAEPARFVEGTVESFTRDQITIATSQGRLSIVRPMLSTKLENYLTSHSSKRIKASVPTRAIASVPTKVRKARKP